MNGLDYQILQSGSSYLGVLAVGDLTLTGTSGADTLTGYGGNDVISGGGGADTLTGGGGNDLITQTAAQPNAAAGSRLDGGDGADTLIFDGSQAYTSSYVTLNGGNGNDLIQAGTKQGQYVGSVQIDGGAGDDTIKVGHIEGGTGGLGYIDGGDGNDLIQVLDTWNGIGIWGNAVFQLRGGAGDDRFVLAGTQLDTKSAYAAQLDGGAGFDTLVWNGAYNLTVGGHQNPAVGLYNGQYAQELAVSNVERSDLVAGGATGLNLSFTAQDVASITAGSDFDRATLGLGLTGTGNVLFVTAGSNQLDLDWLDGAWRSGRRRGVL